MDIEQAERQCIEMAKEKDKRDAEVELYDAFKEIEERVISNNEENDPNSFLTVSGTNTQNETKKSKQSGDFAHEKNLDDASKVFSTTSTKSPLSSKGESVQRRGQTTSEDNVRLKDEQPNNLKETDHRRVSTNGPRSAVKATFKYTPRLFKTPSRESTIAQEEKFIIKNRPFLRTNLLLNKDGIDISDTDPFWLKTKGDEFYCCGDFLSAVHAYSSALECDKSMVQALSNRAACYLHLGKPSLCIKDCTQVLKWCDSESDDKLRQKALVRRGAASCQLGDYEGCLKDYEVVVDIKSAVIDTDLQDDLMMVRRIAQADAMKCKADKILSQGHSEKALGLYDQTIAAFPTFVRALSNRAVCFLTIGNMSDCIRDCSTIVGLLDANSRDSHKKEEGFSSFGSQQFGFNLIPEKDSVEGRLYLTKALSRRGIAKAQLQDFENALNDLRCALIQIDKRNSKEREDLEKDINAIQKMARVTT